MTQDEMKRKAAEAAMQYVVQDEIVGVGTGSTVNHFIDLLAGMKAKIKGAVSSSVASTERMKKHVRGWPCLLRLSWLDPLAR